MLLLPFGRVMDLPVSCTSKKGNIGLMRHTWLRRASTCFLKRVFECSFRDIADIAHWEIDNSLANITWILCFSHILSVEED